MTLAGILLAVAPSAAQTTAAASGKPAVEEGYLTGADQVKLFYRKLGSGKDAIVFLHGGPGLSINDGGYVMDPLAQRHTLIMYDQRGGGRSDLVKQPELLTADADVRDLEAVRQRFGIEKMTLVGLSWGSGLAALYAEAHPERVTRIVFLDPMPPANKPYAQERNQRIQSLLKPEDLARLQELGKQMESASDDTFVVICREQFRIFFRPYFYHPERADSGSWDLCNSSPAALRNFPVVNRAVNASLGNFDLRPTLSRLKVPALVIECEKTNVPLDATREWAKAPHDARLLLVPDAGHATFVEQPEVVLQAIETFAGGNWPATAKQITDGK